MWVTPIPVGSHILNKQKKNYTLIQYLKKILLSLYFDLAKTFSYFIHCRIY